MLDLPPSDPVPKDFDASKAPNLPEIEKQFAVKCIEQAETYWNLLGAVEPKNLKLTKLDDTILEELKTQFPDLYANKDNKLERLDENEMKSPAGKEAWRKFIAKFENVTDYNFGTLIRTNSTEDYTERNTLFTTRIQFYAIEICRNRLGLNDAAHLLAKKEWEEKRAKKAAGA
ncbi:hypothetical protein CROQUDRAFT_656092 [Cronartium quercuum f. sp. fusiforme G11]|uniref:Polysaccharide biosynthesis domain-containing protein n=1 Tax=Cronartium quercuum f. sp. fusiforme G11 TaxID=708437 RepID=A0A9P6TD84_9BASI|nr:hypothetical protein CROQUDRAFT_656092 [Cronartium quercuum f. sp. fusiforme G11]